MKPLFKIGDYVRVKDGVELQGLPGYFANNWQGEVAEIDEDNEMVLLELDAQTIDSFTDEYFRYCINEETDFEEYYFEINDIEPEPVLRRDTIKLLEQVLVKANKRYFELDDDHYEQEEYDEEAIEDLMNQWFESSHFEALPEEVKKNANFGVDVFAQYAFNYEGANIKNWTAAIVRAVCTDTLPRKVSASAKDIGLMVDALVGFFDWMNLNKLHTQASQMRDEARKVKPITVKIASDPSQWGIAKSMMMGAFDSGVDVNSKDAIDQYLAQVQGQSLSRLMTQNNQKPVVKESPYKNISSNTKITVRYGDGKLMTDKFKRLEKDLSSGKCKLISR
jgi:transcriptional antiterminator Rof (Rho-off)